MSGKVGKGLQSIGINIANLATSTGQLSFAVGDTTANIDLMDEKTGDMLSTYDVLTKISAYWGSMNTAQKEALGSALAG